MFSDKETKNILYNVIYKLLNVLFPLISAGIIARRLLPSGVGKVSAAQNIVTYFTFLAPMGLPVYGIRECSKVSGRKLNIVFSECFIINAISTTICLLGYYLMINFIPYYESEKLLYSIAGLSIAFNYLNIEWFYQGKGEYKYITMRSSFIKIVMLLAIILFIKNPSDYTVYALIYCLAICGNYIFNMIHLKKYSIKFDLSNNALGRHIKPLLILLSSNIAVELYSLVDTTMLAVICDDEIVAYYSNSMKIIKVAIFVIAALGGTTLQRITLMIEEKKYKNVSDICINIIKIMILFAMPCMFGIIAESPNIIYVLYGNKYMKAVITMRILAGLFMFLPFSNFIGTQVLVAFNKEKKVFCIQGIAAVINIILNVCLINQFQQNGAAIASVISEGMVTILMMILVRKQIGCIVDYCYTIQIILASVVMFVCVFLWNKVITMGIVSLISGIVIGGGIYIMILYILKNESILYIYRRFKKLNKSE